MEGGNFDNNVDTIPNFTNSGAKVRKIIEICKKKVKKTYNEKMPPDSWSNRRIFCGIKSRAREERNALTEVARTEQRKPTSNVGLMNEERTAEPCLNLIWTK